MPKPADHPRPAGMNMPVPVDVIRGAVPSLLITHHAQDARKIRLQHIDNNHPDATAKHTQTPDPALTRGERIRSNRFLRTFQRSVDRAHQHGRVAAGVAEHGEKLRPVAGSTATTWASSAK